MTLRRVRSFTDAKKQKIRIPVKFLSFAAIPLLAALATSGNAHAFTLPNAMPSTQTKNVLEAKSTRHSLVAQTVSGFGAIKSVAQLPEVITKTPVTEKPSDTAQSTNTALSAYKIDSDLPTTLPDLTTATLTPAQPQPVATEAAASATPGAPSAPAIKTIDGTAYPYAHAAWPNETVDPWGMYMRQCVSYTAWAVAASGRHMPNWGGSGNAKKWVANAQADGIAVDHDPQEGDVAISMSGTYGHAMYVENVNGDGTIDISQYNAHFDGTYSTDTRSASGLYFIHF